jgi:hypothetical protein
LWQQNTELAEVKELYFRFEADTDGLQGQQYSTTISLYNVPRIAKHYFKYLLKHYFHNKVAAVGIDYVGNLEVWVKDSMQPDAQTIQYLKFSLVPQFKNISEGFELLISFNGYSVVYNRSIVELDIDETLYSRVIADGEVVKYKFLTPEHKNNITQIFPVQTIIHPTMNPISASVSHTLAGTLWQLTVKAGNSRRGG